MFTKLDKVLFEEKINTIKKESLKKYFLVFFTLKIIIFKVVTLILASLLSCLLFFCLRDYALNNLDVIFNRGSALNFGESNQTLVYALKWIPTIFLFLIFVFNNDWYIYIPAFFMGINSFNNIIDKYLIDIYNGVPHYDAVVDYIPFHAWGFYNNIADILIIIATVSIFIGCIIKIVKMAQQDKAKEKANEKDYSSDSQ